MAPSVTPQIPILPKTLISRIKFNFYVQVFLVEFFILNVHTFID